jgi:hypothetical protein
MHKHTPGPWVLDMGGDGELEIYSDQRIGTIALIAPDNPLDTSPEDRANALLIAAAPELAEALRDLVEYAAYCAALLDERPVSLQRAREVLTKAEGTE